MTMLYSFELQMMGIILLSGMLCAGISLWFKRRKEQKALGNSENDYSKTP